MTDQAINETEPHVEQAGLECLPECARLFDQYRQFQGRPSDLHAAHEFLRARLERRESVFLVARWRAVPAGFAQVYPSFSSVALARVSILNDLFVLPEQRRRGVATRLLEAIEQHARSIAAVRVTLNVALSNTSARALYLARGWTPDREFAMLHRHLHAH